MSRKLTKRFAGSVASPAASPQAATVTWHPFDGIPPWAEGRDWSSETPFHWPGGPAVAFDDETGAPLALVWWDHSADGWGLETTHWAPLPAGPAPSQAEGTV